MRPLGKVLSFATLFALLSSLSNAATITGTVNGTSGAPFGGAFVQIQNTKTGITVDVLSDKNGQYRAQDLPAGGYELRVRAVGYRANPRTSVHLNANQNASFDFALQKGVVRWSDLTVYQGEKLFPEGKGRDKFIKICVNCHGFQSRMAAVRLDASGWQDRVNFMRYSVDGSALLTRLLNDQDYVNIVSYLTSLFSADSVLPRSPSEMPAYKDLVQKFSDESTKIVYVEYPLPGPGRFPFGPYADKNAKTIWFPEYSQLNGVGELNPETGQVREFFLSKQPRVAIHSAVPAPDGTVWFTEQTTDRLGHLDPRTKEITEYQDPRSAAMSSAPVGAASNNPNFDVDDISDIPSKHTVRVDPRGILWASGRPFSSFDPGTKKFTEYLDPPETYGIAFDPDGSHVWFVGYTPDGKIYEVDTKTGKMIGSWAPPTAGLPRRLTIDTDGLVWFAEYNAGKLASLDPKTHKFTEYQLPGAKPTPYALGIDRDHYVWYDSNELDLIGRLDPKTGKVVEYPFPYPEIKMREFSLDWQGRMWWTAPANNKIGYFYVAGGKKNTSK